MDIINDYIVFYKVIDAMEQKKKQKPVFPTLAGGVGEKGCACECMKGTA